MAQELRPSKKAGFEYLTVMVPSQFRAELVAQAEAEGRTLSDIVRRELLRSTRSDSHLSPARAIGRLIELYADDLAGYCQTADEWHHEMQAGVPALLNDLFDAADQKAGHRDDGLAVTFARTLAQKVRRAHVAKVRTGDQMTDFLADWADRALVGEQPSLGQLQQEELLKIQKALGLSPDDGVVGKPRSRKGRK